MANMYILIKVHKKNFPGRAVVSQVDDPTYKICKELTRILKPISESGRSYIKNTYDLKEMLKEVNLDGDCLMASLDIVGLYPSIPLKKTLEVIREKLEADDTLSSRTDWKVDNIMKLLEISMHTCFKTLDGKIWVQTDVPYWKINIWRDCRDFHMNWFEETFVFSEENDFKPIFWKRMRYTIFLVWKKGDPETNRKLGSDELDRFLWKLNVLKKELRLLWRERRME